MLFDYRQTDQRRCGFVWLAACVMLSLTLGTASKASAADDVAANDATVTCSLRNQRELDQLERLWGKGGFSIDRMANRSGVPSVRIDGAGSNGVRTRPVAYVPGDRIRIRAEIRAEQVQPKGANGFAPVVAIYFYDEKMESLGHKDVIGFYKGDTAWKSNNDLQGPFPLTVKFWSVCIATGYITSGTAWLNNLQLARVPEEQPAAWEPMLLSRSFGIDELTKGDWQVLRQDDGFIGKPDIARAPDEDWDKRKLNADPPPVSFDRDTLPPPSRGVPNAQSLKISGSPAAYASQYLPYNGERVRFNYWVKHKDLKPGHPILFQIASFELRDGKYHYITHYDTFVAGLAGPNYPPDMDWAEHRGERYFSKAATHLRVWFRAWEGQTGTFWVDRFTMDKLVETAALPVEKERNRIVVDGRKPLGPMIRNWLGVDEMVDSLLYDTCKTRILPLLRDAGVEYVRLHWALSWIWKKNDAAGNAIYDWDGFDSVLDSLRENDLRPMIITEPTPKPLTSRPTKHWVNTSPPTDMKRHGQYIVDVARHCVERYGLEEVEKWYWESWNEPDGHYYFQGTPEEYHEVYDHEATAMRAAFPTLQYGTMDCEATTLEHVQSGVNAATGKAGDVPIGFYTYHFYPGSGAAHPSIKSLERSSTLRMKLHEKYPKLAGKPIINGEWNACYIGVKEGETIYNACGIVKCIRVMVDAGIAQTFLHALWAKQPVPDEDGTHLFGTNSIYLITHQGVPTASLNALRSLNYLTGQRIALERTAEPVDGLASVDERERRMVVVLTNFVENPNDRFTTAVDLDLQVPDWLAGSTVRVQRTLVDKDHGDPYTAWEAMGSPLRADDAQLQKLLEASELPTPESTMHEVCPATLNLSFDMPVQSIVVIVVQGLKERP